jgi:hypothetical protein
MSMLFVLLAVPASAARAQVEERQSATEEWAACLEHANDVYDRRMSAARSGPDEDYWWKALGAEIGIRLDVAHCYINLLSA